MRTPCQNDPDLWFSTSPADQIEAIDACRNCPLMFECRNFGADEIHGVWGGTIQGRSGVPIKGPVRATCGFSLCGKEFAARNRTQKYCCVRHQQLAESERLAAKRREERAANHTEQECAYGQCDQRFVPSKVGHIYCTRACGDRAKVAAARLHSMVEAS